MRVGPTAQLFEPSPVAVAGLGSGGKIVPIDVDGRPSGARNGAWRGVAPTTPVGVRRHGEELACAIEAQAVDQLLRDDLGFDIGRVRVVYEMDQRDEIGDAPRPGHEARDAELQRMIRRVRADVRVDSVRVLLQVRPRRGLEHGGVAIAVAAYAEYPHPDVARQRACAESGGQFASPRGSIELHLHEPVLRRDEALRAKEVGRIRREDVGNAKLVAEHRHRRDRAPRVAYGPPPAAARPSAARRRCRA